MNALIGNLSFKPLGRISLLLTLAIASVFISTKAMATPPPGYYLVWSDEFNGNGLDLSKWYYFNQISQDTVDTIDAITVTNGYLTINTYTTNGVNYSGIIGNDGHYRSFYGYYESSISFCDTNSTWSAFWLQSPSEGQHIGDPAASGAEVDMAEHRYINVTNLIVWDSVQETLHWDGYGTAEQTINPGQKGSGINSGFHTYSLLWTSTNYQYGIDGANTFTTNAGHSDRTEVIMFSAQSQTPSWAGNAPAGGFGPLGVSAVKTVVDYVRYYAPAQTLIWTGTVSPDWNDTNNWFANMTPTATNDMVFNWLSTGNFNIPFAQPTTVNSLSLQETPPMDFSGAPLTIGGGGINMLSAFYGSTIDAPVVVAADQSWRTGTGIQLTLNNQVSGPGNLGLGGWGPVLIAGTNYCITTLNNGLLSVSGKQGNALFVTGGTVAGTGLFSGYVQLSGGTLAVNLGQSVTISNTLAVQQAGSVTFAVDATANTSGKVTGLTSANYGGSLILNNISGPFAATNSFKLFDAASYSGSFASIVPSIPGYQLAWDTSTLTNDGTLRIKAVVLTATTNVLESRSGPVSGGANNPAFSFVNFSTTISSGKSTAPGLSAASCRFAGTGTSVITTNPPATAFSVTPTLLVGPTYRVDVTWGNVSGFPESSNLMVAPTATGVSDSALPAVSSAFAAGPNNTIVNQWVPVGTITPNTANPTLTFTYTGGFTTGSGRWYVDAVRFVTVLPAPGTMSFAVAGNTNIVMNWSGAFTLQSSTNVAGPYADVPGPVITGPYTNGMTAGQQFFRLRN
jgi:hypothetical protein